MRIYKCVVAMTMQQNQEDSDVVCTCYAYKEVLSSRCDLRQAGGLIGATICPQSSIHLKYFIPNIRFRARISRSKQHE